MDVQKGDILEMKKIIHAVATDFLYCVQVWILKSAVKSAAVR